jgi:hypothetical protein
MELVSRLFFISFVALALFKTFDPETFKRLQVYLHDQFGMSIVGSDGSALTSDEITYHFRDQLAKEKPSVAKEIQTSSQKFDISFLSDAQIWRMIAQKYLPDQM